MSYVIRKVPDQRVHMRLGIFMSQYPTMQQTILRVKPADAYRLTWAVVVRIHMYVMGIFFIIQIINKNKDKLEQHRPRSACPAAALFHPSSLLSGVLYNIQLFSVRDLSNETTLLLSATDDKGG